MSKAQPGYKFCMSELQFPVNMPAMQHRIPQRRVGTRHAFPVKGFDINKKQPNPLADKALGKMQHPNKHPLANNNPQDLTVQPKERLQGITVKDVPISALDPVHEARLDVPLDRGHLPGTYQELHPDDLGDQDAAGGVLEVSARYCCQSVAGRQE